VSRRIGFLLVSNVPGGKCVFATMLVVVPHEACRTRPVVGNDPIRACRVHIALVTRLVVSVIPARAVSDAIAASAGG